MQRREFLGGAIATLTANTVSNVATSISLLNGNTFPTGSVNPFVIVISRGFQNEEKILISSRSGNTLTVSQRGYDGTSAATHQAGATVHHVLDAIALQDMNKQTYDNRVLLWMGV